MTHATSHDPAGVEGEDRRGAGSGRLQGPVSATVDVHNGSRDVHGSIEGHRGRPLTQAEVPALGDTDRAKNAWSDDRDQSHAP